MENQEDPKERPHSPHDSASATPFEDVALTPLTRIRRLSSLGQGNSRYLISPGIVLDEVELSSNPSVDMAFDSDISYLRSPDEALSETYTENDDVFEAPERNTTPASFRGNLTFDIHSPNSEENAAPSPEVEYNNNHLSPTSSQHAQSPADDSELILSTSPALPSPTNEGAPTEPVSSAFIGGSSFSNCRANSPQESGAAEDVASSPVDIPETENSDFEIPSTSLEEPTSNLRIMPVVDALLMSGGTNQDVLTDQPDSETFTGTLDADNAQNQTSPENGNVEVSSDLVTDPTTADPSAGAPLENSSENDIRQESDMDQTPPVGQPPITPPAYTTDPTNSSDPPPLYESRVETPPPAYVTNDGLNPSLLEQLRQSWNDLIDEEENPPPNYIESCVNSQSFTDTLAQSSPNIACTQSPQTHRQLVQDLQLLHQGIVQSIAPLTEVPIIEGIQHDPMLKTKECMDFFRTKLRSLKYERMPEISVASLLCIFLRLMYKENDLIKMSFFNVDQTYLEEILCNPVLPDGPRFSDINVDIPVSANWENLGVLISMAQFHIVSQSMKAIDRILKKYQLDKMLTRKFSENTLEHTLVQLRCYPMRHTPSFVNSPEAFFLVIFIKNLVSVASFALDLNYSLLCIHPSCVAFLEVLHRLFQSREMLQVSPTHRVIEAMGELLHQAENIINNIHDEFSSFPTLIEFVRNKPYHRMSTLLPMKHSLLDEQQLLQKVADGNFSDVLYSTVGIEGNIINFPLAAYALREQFQDSKIAYTELLYEATIALAPMDGSDGDLDGLLEPRKSSIPNSTATTAPMSIPQIPANTIYHSSQSIGIQTTLVDPAIITMATLASDSQANTQIPQTCDASTSPILHFADSSRSSDNTMHELSTTTATAASLITTTSDSSIPMVTTSNYQIFTLTVTASSVSTTLATSVPGFLNSTTLPDGLAAQSVATNISPMDSLLNTMSISRSRRDVVTTNDGTRANSRLHFNVSELLNRRAIDISKTLKKDKKAVSQILDSINKTGNDALPKRQRNYSDSSFSSSSTNSKTSNGIHYKNKGKTPAAKATKHSSFSNLRSSANPHDIRRGNNSLPVLPSAIPARSGPRPGLSVRSTKAIRAPIMSTRSTHNDERNRQGPSNANRNVRFSIYNDHVDQSESSGAEQNLNNAFSSHRGSTNPPNSRQDRFIPNQDQLRMTSFIRDTFRFGLENTRSNSFRHNTSRASNNTTYTRNSGPTSDSHRDRGHPSDHSSSPSDNANSHRDPSPPPP